MTGDGVNDAPALRSADIGVAMGQRGGSEAPESEAGAVLFRLGYRSFHRALRESPSNPQGEVEPAGR